MNIFLKCRIYPMNLYYELFDFQNKTPKDNFVFELWWLLHTIFFFLFKLSEPDDLKSCANSD